MSTSASTTTTTLMLTCELSAAIATLRGSPGFGLSIAISARKPEAYGGSRTSRTRGEAASASCFSFGSRVTAVPSSRCSNEAPAIVSKIGWRRWVIALTRPTHCFATPE